jgi:hypothetical protein
MQHRARFILFDKKDYTDKFYNGEHTNQVKILTSISNEKAIFYNLYL